jgi:hypothetical protein
VRLLIDICYIMIVGLRSPEIHHDILISNLPFLEHFNKKNFPLEPQVPRRFSYFQNSEFLPNLAEIEKEASILLVGIPCCSKFLNYFGSCAVGVETTAGIVCHRGLWLQKAKHPHWLSQIRVIHWEEIEKSRATEQ